MSCCRLQTVQLQPCHSTADHPAAEGFLVRARPQTLKAQRRPCWMAVLTCVSCAATRRVVAITVPSLAKAAKASSSEAYGNRYARYLPPPVPINYFSQVFRQQPERSKTFRYITLIKTSKISNNISEMVFSVSDSHMVFLTIYSHKLTEMKCFLVFSLVNFAQLQHSLLKFRSDMFVEEAKNARSLNSTAIDASSAGYGNVSRWACEVNVSLFANDISMTVFLRLYKDSDWFLDIMFIMNRPSEVSV